ncbi:MAG: PaeR7I family type II restriction endonuclease [Thermoanaerobaculales bacterium]|nr:PaeR7I family type II restriction endonuclease [Thermoanaerobaculales bacterium]
MISGKNMDGFIELVRRVAAHCGLPMESVHTRRRDVVLPGYFRPTKNWDVLVIHQGRLLAAFEFKSQVGSFGNNFNNRSEEVIGTAADLWAANRQNAYRLYGSSYQSPVFVSEPGAPLLNPIIQDDPRPPFLAWLMLLEDCPKSRTPVKVDEPHFSVFPEFKGASYAKRYQVLCERLMSRRLYGAAALVLSESDDGVETGAYSTLSTATGLKSLFTAFAAKLLSTLAEVDDGG